MAAVSVKRSIVNPNKAVSAAGENWVGKATVLSDHLFVQPLLIT